MNKVHKSKISKAAIAEYRFVEIDHPPYSPNLLPCDNFLFPSIKKLEGGQNLGTMKKMNPVLG